MRIFAGFPGEGSSNNCEIVDKGTAFSGHIFETFRDKANVII